MFEKIVDILKAFFEKHFLPTLFSIVITSVVFYLTPDDSSVLIKLGRNFYLLTIFCFILFISECVIIFIKKINNKITHIKEKNKYKNKILQENKNYLYDLLESLSPEAFELVEYFVDNDNRCITSYNDYFGIEYGFNTIFDSKRYKIKEDSITSVDPYDLDKKCSFKKGDYVSQFKLKEEIYENLKYLKRKNGRISRF